MLQTESYFLKNSIITDTFGKICEPADSTNLVRQVEKRLRDYMREMRKSAKPTDKFYIKKGQLFHNSTMVDKIDIRNQLFWQLKIEDIENSRKLIERYLVFVSLNYSCSKWLLSPAYFHLFDGPESLEESSGGSRGGKRGQLPLPGRLEGGIAPPEPSTGTHNFLIFLIVLVTSLSIFLLFINDIHILKS